MKTRHGTFFASFSMKTPRSYPFALNVSTSYELAPEGTFGADDFSYERSQGTFSLGLPVTTSSSLAVRVYTGVTETKGEVPELALFKPNELKEARVRLDVSDVERSHRIQSLGVDLDLPLPLPLPADTIVLTQRVRMRLFFDAAKAQDPHHDYRSAGLGMSLPFGGDIVGAGTLAFTRLTILGILYAEVDEKTSRDPAIVFDLSGEL